MHNCLFVAYAFSGAAAGAAVTAREHENAEEALQRRLKESARVEERVTQIYTAQDFDRELQEVCVSLTFPDVVHSLAAAISYYQRNTCIGYTVVTIMYAGR